MRTRLHNDCKEYLTSVNQEVMDSPKGSCELNMEVEHTNPSRHHEGQAGERDNWHRRLRLRKSTASPLTEKCTKGRKVHMKPSKKPTRNELKKEHVVDSSSSKLEEQLKNNSDNSPNCLQNHFRNLCGDRGEPPSFYSEMCSSATPEFTGVQEHHIKHSPMCMACNCEVLQSSSHLTKQCETQHCMNSHYQCGRCKCKQELTKCSESNDTDSAEKSTIKPMNGDMDSKPLDAADGTLKKEELLQHMATACHRRWSRKNWQKRREATPKQPDSKPDIPFLIPKPEVKWTSSGLLPFSAAGLLDENGELLSPARTLEESEQFLEKTAKSGKKWPVTLKDECSLSYTGPLYFETKIKQCGVSLTMLGNSEKNKLSGLMEKNNISVPPDCTTEVVGFKMVDGRKHLVLKVIPSAKTSIRPPTTEESLALNLKESNGIKINSHIESDQLCDETSDIATKNGPVNDDSVSASFQAKNQGAQEPSEDISQVNNTENECSKDQSAFSEGPGAPAQLTVSGIKEGGKVANQKSSEKQPTSPDVMFDRSELNSGSVDMPHSNTLHIKMQEIDDVKQKALRDENHRELSTNKDITCCAGDLSSTMNSELSTLMSDSDRSPTSEINIIEKNPERDAAIIQLPLVQLDEQTMENVFKLSQEKRATVESNIDPVISSSPKCTDYLLPAKSPSEEGLLFCENGDECSVDSSHAQDPLDQNCATETVKEPFSTLGDLCYNADLYHTLEELPVTTTHNLLDDSESTFRDITTHSNEPGDHSAKQMDMQPSKAIAAAVGTEVSSQAISCTQPVNEPGMSRKRQHKPVTRDSQEPVTKAKRQLAQKSQENKPSALYWEPVPPGVERTLWLFPLCSTQPVKFPCLNQPVVVLNHPDADIPEVTNIMRSVHRLKGAVQSVVLSQGTLKALSEFNCDSFHNSRAHNCRSSHFRRVWPQGTVKERFSLKLKLKRLGSRMFEVVPPGTTKLNRFQSSFRCWFCSRLFKDQELWVGHGQRHLMEATRDWNELFKSDKQYNSPIQSCLN